MHSPGRENCSSAPIFGGAFGAGLGLAVVALIYKTTIVTLSRRSGHLLYPQSLAAPSASGSAAKGNGRLGMVLNFE
jgi:hypothetical protein